MILLFSNNLKVADEPNFSCIKHIAHFLVQTQNFDGVLVKKTSIHCENIKYTNLLDLFPVRTNIYVHFSELNKTLHPHFSVCYIFCINIYKYGLSIPQFFSIEKNCACNLSLYSTQIQYVHQSNSYIDFE